VIGREKLNMNYSLLKCPRTTTMILPRRSCVVSACPRFVCYYKLYSNCEEEQVFVVFAEGFIEVDFS